MIPLRFVRHGGPQVALGCAVDLLRLAKPFASYPFGQLAGVLMGQVRRGHYFLTFDHDLLVGFAGWALCSSATAEAWVRGERYPEYEECLAGDSWVGVTFYASSRRVCLAQARQLRRLYPDKHVYFRRDDGKSARPVVIHRERHARAEAERSAHGS